MATITNEDYKRLGRFYESKVKQVSESRDMTEDQKKTLLLVLNNVSNVIEDRKSYNEAAVRGGITQPESIKWFPQTVIDMTSRIYASSILEDIVHVQPIDSPMGQIVFFQSVYGDTRGDNLKGNVAIDDLGSIQNHRFRNNYASPRIQGEPASVNKGQVELHVAHLPIVIDADNPVVLTSASDSSKRYQLRRTGTSSYALTALDASGYPIGGDILKASTGVEVDTEAGLIVFESEDTNFKALSSVFVDYTQDLQSAPAFSGRLRLEQRVEPIRADAHKLRVEYAFDAGYMLQNSFGVDIQKTLIEECTMEMKQERDNEVIDILMRQAGNHATWDRTNDNYISQREHDESFIGELFACANQIYQESQKFRGNYVIVGKKGMDILMNVGRPRFEPNYVESPNGPYVAGILDNSLKVICSPFIRPNEFLVGHKSNLVNASAIVADYLPIMHTDWLTHDTFKVEKGFVSYWGFKLLRPKLLVRGQIVGY